MPHRIIFSDIDGTLLNAERELSACTITEIKRVKDTIPVVLISSRMPSAMTHLQQQLEITDQPLICYNGGLILVNNQPIHSIAIAPNVIETLHQFNANQQFHISLYHNDEWYVPKLDFWANREANNTKVSPIVKSTQEVIDVWKKENIGAHKIMCMGEEKEIDLAFEFLETNYKDELHLYRSKPTYIEIAHKSISKRTAIEKVLKDHFKIPLKDAIAFGDNYNDIEMIEAVGTGVAVANAKEETKTVADVITLAGKEDGVAIYIKNNI